MIEVLKSIFRKHTAKAAPPVEATGKCEELLKWERFLETLHRAEHYISRKEYLPEVQRFSETMQFIKMIDENQLLEAYCQKNGFSVERARELYLKYENMTDLVDQFNDRYVNRKLAEEKRSTR